MGPAQWERVRAIRLRALADAPDAFATTHADAAARPPEHWRERLADDASRTFLASVAGEDVGLVVGSVYREAPGSAGLFGMWVVPEGRGRGIARALVATVVAWARAAGYRRLLLDVADENLPAVRLYERCGFRATGVTGSLPPPREHVREHQRALDLDGAGTVNVSR
jgi:ribosomal protein S18 acetylase RimI-like enzyme